MIYRNFSQEWQDTQMGLRPVKSYLNFDLEAHEMTDDRNTDFRQSILDSSLTLPGYCRIDQPGTIWTREALVRVNRRYDAAGDALKSA